MRLRQQIVGLLWISVCALCHGQSVVLKEWYVASPFPHPPFEVKADYVGESRRFIRPTERYQVLFPGPMRDASGEMLEPSPWGFAEDRPWEVGWEAKTQESTVFDLAAHTPIKSHVASYLMTYLEVEESCLAWFHVGSHDTAQLFVDGASLLTISNEPPGRWREGHARVPLESGDHTVLVKILGGEGQHDVQVRLDVDGEEEIGVRHGLAASVGEFWCHCAGLAGADAMGGNLVAYLDEPDKEVSDRASSLHVQAAAPYPSSVVLDCSISGPDGEMVGRHSLPLELGPDKAASFVLPVEWKRTGWYVLEMKAERAEGETAGESVGEVDIPFLVLSHAVLRRRSTDREEALRRMRLEATRRDRLIQFLEGDRDALRTALAEREAVGAESKAAPGEELEAFEPQQVGRTRLALSRGWKAAWADGDQAPEGDWFDPPMSVGAWWPEADKPLWLRVQVPSPPNADKGGVRLLLDRASHRTLVWCNGQAAGEGFGDFVPLFFDLDESWNWEGENEICLRLESAARLAGPERYLRRWERPFLEENRVGLAGDPVLLFHPSLWVEDLSLSPKREGREIEFSVRVTNGRREKASCLLEMMLLSKGQILSRLPWRDLEIGPKEARETVFSVPWPLDRRWPGSGGAEGQVPLFHLAASLRIDPAGPAQDQETFRFGVSRVEARGTRLMLNDAEIRLRSVALSPAAASLAAKDWVALVRGFMAKGANGFVLKGCTDVQLGLADEMRVLVQPYMTPPCVRVAREEKLWEEYKQLVRSWAERGENHPCVVSWSTDDGLTSLLRQDAALDSKLLELDAIIAEQAPGRIVDHRGCPSSWWMDGFDVAHFAEKALCHGALFGWEGRYRRPVFVDEEWNWEEPGPEMEALRKRLRDHEFRRIPCVTLVPSGVPPERLLDACHALPTEDVWPADSAPLPRRTLLSVAVVHAGLAAPGLWVGLEPGQGCPGRRRASRTDEEGRVSFLCEPGSWTAYCVAAGERVETSFVLDGGGGWTEGPCLQKLEIP